ncbi:Stage V sporulation protein K [Symbiodinium microadriaticum]|uniref:Stage V sporulation protein K n=2 Tax=Symbiodinium microadriaticum TaxID=2951 RepID=A0A1Q9BZW4_SYMMI|nr:Stage V sporulation protein K [Symbiodinium microadriaticum]
MAKGASVEREASRADLVGEYVGATALKVQKVVQEAMGGVLFIDEAYALVQGSRDSYGVEAVDTLIKEMEDNRAHLIVILAGYTKEMDDFFNSNPGFRSRVPFSFSFEDYTCPELVQIGQLQLKSKAMELKGDGSCEEQSTCWWLRRAAKLSTHCCDHDDRRHCRAKDDDRRQSQKPTHRKSNEPDELKKFEKALTSAKPGAPECKGAVPQIQLGSGYSGGDLRCDFSLLEGDDVLATITDMINLNVLPCGFAAVTENQTAELARDRHEWSKLTSAIDEGAEANLPVLLGPDRTSEPLQHTEKGEFALSIAGERGPGGEESPAKKGRTQDQALTLSMLRTVLAEERERDREHLASSLAGVKSDVMNMQGRVQEVENIVQQQVQDTVRALDRVTRSYDKQAGALEEVKAAQFQLEARLQSLEQKPPSTAPGSTADTEGGRRPALIIGGWHPDQAAEDTLKAAREVLRSLDVPLNGDELFVPGLRRGYAILPITPKPFEDEDARRARIQGAIQKVRNANVMLGKNEAGGMRKLWIAISQSPERRKRAKLAGKVKRMILEMGGAVRDMEVEFATGTVWYQHQKVSSATAEKPPIAETAGAGWVDVKHIAKLLRKPLAEVEASWGDRKAELL